MSYIISNWLISSSFSVYKHFINLCRNVTLDIVIKTTTRYPLITPSPLEMDIDVCSVCVYVCVCVRMFIFVVVAFVLLFFFAVVFLTSTIKKTIENKWCSLTPHSLDRKWLTQIFPFSTSVYPSWYRLFYHYIAETHL
jgi:hypothetical protein